MDFFGVCIPPASGVSDTLARARALCVRVHETTRILIHEGISEPFSIDGGGQSIHHAIKPLDNLKNALDDLRRNADIPTEDRE